MSDKRNVIMIRKVYMLYNLIDDEIYVGQTRVSIKYRSRMHKSRSKIPSYQSSKLYHKINEVGWSNIRIVEMESLLCVEREIKELERAYMDRLKPTLNTNETGLLFKEDGTFDEVRYYKDYRRDNADAISKKRADYYRENIDKINEIIVCPCGIKSTCNNLRRHKKTKTHKKLMLEKSLHDKQD